MVFKKVLLIMGLAIPAFADTGFVSTIRVSEADSSPACTVGQLKVSNGSLACNGQVANITTGGGSGGGPLAGGATSYIQNRSTLQSGATAYPDFLYVGSSETITGPGGLRVTYGVTVGTLTSLGASVSGASGNTESVLNIFKTNASVSGGDYIMSIGTVQQVDQLVIRDQFPVVFDVYGTKSGSLSIGIGGFNDKIMSGKSIDQHIDFWNSGNMIIQSGFPSDGAKDIIIKPTTVEAFRLSSVTGITASSSMTVTAAGGIGVNYGVIVGSITINTGGSSGQTVCWKSATTLGYCSSVVGIGGACTCN